MATNFPTSLDSTSNLGDAKTDNTLTVGDHAALHNNVSDAIIAVETELGINPSGTYSTVGAAILNKVDVAPNADQVIQPLADHVALVVMKGSGSFTSNLFEARLQTNSIVAFIDSLGGLSAQSIKVAGTPLASTHLSDTALLARLASPALTGTPTAPTPAGGDNSSKIATTAFVAAATPAAITSGTLGTIPAASTRPGLFYYANDQDVLYFSNGTAWVRQGLPAGATMLWFHPGAVVPTGWVAYNGSSLPGSTGIYASLYAHLGNTLVTPDTRGRMPVGLGTHTDVATVGNNEGISVVASRRPKHNSTIHDPGHAHAFSAKQNAFPEQSVNGAGNPGNVSGSSTSSATTGITIGPQTGAEPIDTPAYIVTLLIAKL